jgi:Fe-S cluster assembly protein SufD
MTKHITIKSEQKKTLLLETLENTEIILEEDANLTIVAFLEKGWQKPVRPPGGPKKLTFTFKEKNSVLNFIGIIIAKKNNSFQFETISNHVSQHTKSFYNIRSVLFDKSEIDYKGTLIIEKTAQHTDTHLSHRNLSFSNEAKIKTIPCLEIEANNVHAGHSAAIGKIDKDQLFYMQSRGITTKNAEKILTKSFLWSDLDKIEDKKIKQFVIDKLERLK